MAARGPYAKGRAKRAEILDAALDVIDCEGYSGATVRQLADAVGLSQNGLLHYFGSKDALFTEILRHQDERNAASVAATHLDFAAELVKRILDAVDYESASPGVPQLMLRLSGEATDDSHPANEFFRLRYEAIREVIGSAVEERRKLGTIGADIDTARTATLIFAAWEGLRTQWLYDRRIDLRAQMTYLLDRLGINASQDPQEPSEA